MFKYFLWFTILYCVAANDIIRGLLPYFPPECIPSSLKMIDASGKFPSGILSGNLIEIGAFDQCISVKDYVKNSTDIIKGKYCLMNINLFNSNNNTKPKGQENIFQNELNNFESMQSLPLIIGWCIPDKCDPTVLAHNISTSIILQWAGMRINSILPRKCQTEDDLKIELSGSDWGAIGFFIVIGVIIFLSTGYDIYLHFTQQSTAHVLFIAFSIKTNSEKLLKISNNPDQLGCLHGIRFISMMWVLLGHGYLATVMQPTKNLLDIIELSQSGWHMYIINGPLSVDTFFLLSGLLVGYGYCLAKDKGVKFNVLLYYIHRYLRLTPALGAVILVHATILPYFGSGPLWPVIVESLKGPCTTNWWTTLLYIQNYYETTKMCIGQSWYLAVDFQLFILSPIILLPLWRWPKQTMIGCCLLLVGSVISPFVISYHFKLKTLLINAEDPEYMKQYYFATHARFGVWVMGIMMGYYLFKLKKDKINNQINNKLDTVGVLFGWMTSLTIMLVCLFAGHSLQNVDDRLQNALFNSLFRQGWAFGICWVIYACTQGYGGVINLFLSWSAFQILGRFTYSIYLVHLTTQYLISGSARTSQYFTDFLPMYNFWGDLMFSLGIGICLTLAFESPILTIEKVIFNPDSFCKKPRIGHEDSTRKEI